jgi:TPR repeat protein
MGVFGMDRRLGVVAVLLALFSMPVFAQMSLGTNAPRLFDQGMDVLQGVGVSTNSVNAIDYFHRSADLGFAPAQVMMGYFYETGSQVPADPSAAADWYKKAAKQDDRLGAWLLGRMYYTGNGVPRDLDAAETWLKRAANQGDPYGEYLLGLVKLERNDYVNAAPMFRKAALQGIPLAQQQFADLLKDGKGVNADKFQAYVWLLVSYQAGNQAAASDLSALEPALGTNQVTLAKNKARDLEQTATRAVVAHSGCTGWPGEFGIVPAPPPPDIQRFCH